LTEGRGGGTALVAVAAALSLGGIEFDLFKTNGFCIFDYF
jgi:hypothetical protein